jgi:hypothetical protein
MGVDKAVQREILRILIGNFDENNFKSISPQINGNPVENESLKRTAAYNNELFIAKDVAKIISDYPRHISFDGKLRTTLKNRYERMIGYLLKVNMRA